MRAVIEKYSFPEGGRVIAVSDVHGELSYLKGLLRKLNLTPEDNLVLVGDMVEKGPDSLGTLRYIMELCREYPRVRMIHGNCDCWTPELDFPTPGVDRFLLRYLRSEHSGWHRGLLRQMLDEAGFELTEGTDVSEIRRVLCEGFVPELDFLRSLPHALDTPHYTFVHGGIPEGDPESWDHWKCMKNDSFMTQGRSFDKWQIVGHTPVVLYGGDIVCANPVIDRQSRIISIDGGCVLKDDGQLNALIIPFDGSEDFGFTYYDEFPVYRALEPQSASSKSAYLRWGDNGVEILEDMGEFTRCRHTRTGYVMDILSRYLRKTEDGWQCNDCTDYVLPVETGDALSVIEVTSRGYFVKKNGVSGWYYGTLGREDMRR